MHHDTLSMSNMASLQFVEPSEFGDPDDGISPRRCVIMRNPLPQGFYIAHCLGARVGFGGSLVMLCYCSGRGPVVRVHRADGLYTCHLNSAVHI